MKRALMLLFMLLPATAWADTILFTVNPVDQMVPKSLQFDVFSSGLNGTVFTGQSLSLDLLLAGDLLARINAATYGIDLTLSTNAGMDPGFFGAATTGSVLGRFGPLGSFDVGRSMSSNGDTSAGMPFITHGPNDIRGFHFDAVLPSTGWTVTNATLRFTLPNPNSTVIFGTAAQLPEPQPLLLVSLGVPLIIALKAKARRGWGKKIGATRH